MIETILVVIAFVMLLMLLVFEPKFEIIAHHNRRLLIIWHNKYDKMFFKDNTYKREYILIDLERIIYGK